jgi:hypothetical protein
MSPAIREIAQGELEQVERVLALDPNELDDPAQREYVYWLSEGLEARLVAVCRGLGGHESGLRLIVGGRDVPPPRMDPSG